MIIGPWDHLQGSSGAEVGNAGYGTLAELQLRWFDHYVKGMPDRRWTTTSRRSPTTSRAPATGARRSDWVGSDRHATTWRLSGGALRSGSAGGLTTGDGRRPARPYVLPVPVAGLCTRSTNQWTAGIVGADPAANPCLADNPLNDQLGVVFQTAPMTEPLRSRARSTPGSTSRALGGDGMLSVAVEDVAPDGTVTRLTGGWQVISHRALDTAKSRYLDGKLDPAVPPVHQGGRDALASRARSRRSTSRSSRPARDPARPPAADRGPGVRRPAPGPDPARAAGHADGDDDPQLARSTRRC